MNEEGVSRTKTAYHEAGHAVVAYHRGLHMEGADVVATGDRAGALKMGDYPVNWNAGAYGEPRTSWYCGIVMTFFAGIQAVELFTGKPAGEDDSNLMQLPGTDWSGVAKLFDELGQDALDQAHDKAEQVLRDNWHAVEAVAEALLERATLDKGQLYAVLEEAGCVRDEEAVALVEEAYREGRFEVLVDERFRLVGTLEEARDRGAPKGEVANLEQELVRVDGEVVELGGDSIIRWSEPEEGTEEEHSGAGGA